MYYDKKLERQTILIHLILTRKFNQNMQVSTEYLLQNLLHIFLSFNFSNRSSPVRFVAFNKQKIT